MNANWQDVARATNEGSESGAMTFPQSVRMLMAAGFDGYAVDFRRSTRTYYGPDGEAIELKTAPTEKVAERFDEAAIKEAIREAQALVPGYTYRPSAPRSRGLAAPATWFLSSSASGRSIGGAPAKRIPSIFPARSRPRAPAAQPSLPPPN